MKSLHQQGAHCDSTKKSRVKQACKWQCKVVSAALWILAILFLERRQTGKFGVIG